jgi:ferredoxin
MSRVPRVDKGACISCGVCVDTVPAVFRFDGESRAEVYDPDGAEAAAIQEAIDLCPASCIYWEEEG